VQIKLANGGVAAPRNTAVMNGTTCLKCGTTKPYRTTPGSAFCGSSRHNQDVRRGSEAGYGQDAAGDIGDRPADPMGARS
jgi:hypothetical protein